MPNSILVTLGLGLVLGLKHATEADHLAAVSTIVSERRSVLGAARVGALWGLGHTTSLFFAGLLVLLLGIAIPKTVANTLELCVALVIVTLGTRLLYLISRKSRQVHVHAHSHDGQQHLHYDGSPDAHPAVHSHERAHTGLSRWRTFLVGVLHGLAGSAALTLLVLTEVMRNRSALLGLSYLMIFGIGSISGMLIMSSLIGIPFALSSRLPARLPDVVQVFTAVSSVVFGLYYGWQIIS
jgi:high-affinity nickel permease